MPKCATCGSELTEGRPCPACDATIAVNSPATRTVPISTARKQSRTSSGRLAPPPEDESQFVPGTVLAERYRIVALLGKGGMGEVYRADDLTLGQPVALKFLPQMLAQNEDALRRFRNEVRIARKVSHPNVCRVYDVGEVDGHLFLSMEYVDGEDLGSLLRRIGRLPPDKALEISRKLCAGLAAAHERGVLHRDLKPANVMLDGRGQVLLTDFGLADLAEHITAAEARSGTPAYMAPEQLAGKGVSVRSDVYSLGLVIYELFTGKRPFEGDTLAALIQARNENTPTSLATIVRDLDPAVERIVLRCLEADPARRPASALAVSAALPGGDPLAAALAAGETPSPQLVAAAGEGTGFSPRVAIPVFAIVLAGILTCCALAHRTSALEMIQPEYGPEVLAQKAKDIAARIGYAAKPFDDASGFIWNTALASHLEQNEKPFPGWQALLPKYPSTLSFWYRQSPYPLIGDNFHDDLLTPGIIATDTPPPVLSGMIEVDLDAQGRLIQFQAVPPQLLDAPKDNPAPDWSTLFAAAGLDQSQFGPAEPLWTWLASSDTRVAWTGEWPLSRKPLRVEAAALRGKPVAFSLIGPWTKPERMPPAGEAQNAVLLILCTLGLIICGGAAVLARGNLAAGRGDRRGAFRIATFVFIVQMGLWLTRAHFVISLGTFAMFLLAVCTSVFYAVILWTVYLALEPYVRRRWPRTLISWTRVLGGQVNDPLVGRDVLIGTALGVSWVLISRIVSLFGPASQKDLGLITPELLLGMRSALGELLRSVPHAVREALFFFFLLFLLRVLLRNQWLGGAAFVLIWTIIVVLGNDSPVAAVISSVLTYGLTVIVVLRCGLLALATAVFVNGILSSSTLHTSAWYFANIALLVGTAIAIAAWSFWLAVEGSRRWSSASID